MHRGEVHYFAKKTPAADFITFVAEPVINVALRSRYTRGEVYIRLYANVVICSFCLRGF